MSSFFNLLLDYVPKKEEALSSLYDANILYISDIAQCMRHELRQTRHCAWANTLGIQDDYDIEEEKENKKAVLNEIDQPTDQDVAQERI